MTNLNTNTLVFGGSTDYTATDDFGTAAAIFVANSYSFQNSSSGTGVTLAATGTRSFRLGGTTPTLVQNGSGAVTFDSTAPLQVNAASSFTGTGTGTISIATLNVSAALTLSNASNVVIGSLNQGAGLTLSSTGNVTVGTHTLTGANRTITNNLPTANTFSITGNVFLSDLAATGRTLTISGTGTTNISGVISDFNGVGQPGSLIKSNGGTLTLSGANTYSAGSPTTDGKRLYVSFGSFGVFAYDLSGKLLWNRDLGRLNTRRGWGEAVTPVVHGDSVVLNWDQEADSKLIALDAATGKTRWETARSEKTSWNTPLIVQHGKQTQVIVNGTERVRAYDLNDGKVIWQVAGMTTNAIPSPVAANGVAFVMSGYQGAAAIAVSLGSVGDLTETGKVAWRYTKGTPYVPSPLLYGGFLYFTQANGQLLTILDAKTGKPALKEERLPGVTTFYASPVAAAGRVYFVDRSGTIVVLKAGESGEVLATNKLGEPIDASPAIVGKTLFLRGEKHLYALEEK